MGVKGKIAPRESDGGGYWRWLRVDYGTTCTGWIAGDLHVIPVHPGRPSVVCEDALTGMPGACPLCKSQSDVRDLGYQPVYRDDNVPCVLTLHPHQFEQVSGYAWGVPVLWGRRSGDDAESTYVQPRLTAAGYTTTLPSRRQPADITIAICRYWKRPDLLPALLRWFGRDTQPAQVPVTAPVPVRAVTVKPTTATRPKTSVRQAIKDITGEDPGELLSATAKAMLAKAKARERQQQPNGVHS